MVDAGLILSMLGISRNDFDWIHDKPMVVVVEYVHNGNLVIQRRFNDGVGVVFCLRKIIVVGAEAHGTVKGIARFIILSTEKSRAIR